MVKWNNCLVWILEKKVGQLYEIVGQVWAESRRYGRIEDEIHEEGENETTKEDAPYLID